MPTYDHINVSTQDGIRLNGLYSGGDTNKPACIFIHGFTTDFYSHAFYHSIATALHSQNRALVLAQTRGTGLHTEYLKTNGEGVYLGSYFERIEDAHLDISTFVEFLQSKGHAHIILMGHSLGTIKVVRYLFEGRHADLVSKLVLLAPFDKNAFMEMKAPGKWHEFVEIAKQKIAEGKEEEIVPVPTFEDFPMSYRTFYSWYEPSHINRIWDFYDKDYDFPYLQKIKVPVKVILGDKDDFINYGHFSTTHREALEIIKHHVPVCETVLIPNSAHTYVGYEDVVAQKVLEFINN